MARYGSPWACGYGSPDNHFEYCYIDTTALAASGYAIAPLVFKPRSGYGDAYACIMLNAEHVQNVYMAEGTECRVLLTVPYGTQTIHARVFRIGHLADPAYSMVRVARVYEHTEGLRPTLQFPWTPEIIEPELAAGSYTSAWALTGLLQGINTSPVVGHPTWGRLNYSIEVDGGNTTVTLRCGSRTVAEGTSATGGAPFTVTLLEVADSGVSGSLTVDNTVIDTTGGVLDIRWPAYMQVLRDTSDPPTTVVATIPWRSEIIDAAHATRWTEPSALAAGTYYYRARPLSDTGSTGTATASVPLTTIAAPAAPTGLAYSSGDMNTLVLAFNRSSTALATYRLYGTEAIGTPPNMDDPVATAVAGTPGGATTISVPAISGAPGKAFFILRAVSSGGVEERNIATLEVEFDSVNARVPPRPNVPRIIQSSIAITSGRTVALNATYNAARQRVAPNAINLYSRTVGGSYNYAGGAEDATVAVTASGITITALSKAYGADAYRYLVVRAAAADGTLSPVDESGEVLVYVSTATMAAPGSLTAELSRS